MDAFENDFECVTRGVPQVAALGDQMEHGQKHVDELDADKRHDHAAQAPDQQVAPQQGVGADGPILDPLQGDRDQQRE